jgi:predicted PurR-regulated permease PerM
MFISRININFVLSLVLAVFLFWIASPFFTSILFAAIVAFSLRPVQKELLEKRYNFSHSLSVYSVLFLMLLFLTPFVLSFLSFMNEARNFIQSMSDSGDFNSIDDTVEFVYRRFTVLESYFSIDQAKGASKQALGKLSEGSVDILKSLLVSVPNFMIGVFFFVASAYYFISDASTFRKYILDKNLFPEEELKTWLNILQSSCRSTILAALMTGAAQSFLISVAAYLAGADFIFTIFFITFFLSQIPIIGTAPVSLGLVAFFYMTGHPYSALAMMVAGGAAGLSDNIIRAWFLSSYDDLHPLVGLISAIGGVIVCGPLGVILGPVSALAFNSAAKKGLFRLTS